jgi:hypothetical protein
MDHGKLVEEGSHDELLAADGLYARLVRIQTQLTTEPTVNGLVLADSAAGDRQGKLREENNGRRCSKSVGWRPEDGDHPEEAESLEVAALFAEDKAHFMPRWLTPDTVQIRRGEHDTLQVLIGTQVHDGVFAVRALPASCPDRFISLRHADADGQDHEIGLIADLADWPTRARTLLERALDRRYFIRHIQAIDSIKLQYGLLTFDVQTNRGPATFTMRSSHSQAQDYGRAGKILIDVDDNRFLVPDVDALPRRQQTLFRRYIYW